ncbi:hypothetical protein [Jiangella rhizosphaerae]|uniref:Uncharacterized protein n=1 Tax=Jiangella rhizosphaerae TaxID=2293569 RepID=A0A418KTW4_9ACTN|nr:hypothetical protein [Jiangella rhizosphaerae]RIQ31030.1 hypothetical protein DY240_07020 [Jiangella rhizosphaerae]
MTAPVDRQRRIASPFARDDVRYAIGRALLLGCAVVMALHLLAVVVRMRTRPEGGVLADVLALLNGGHERSLASWWTSALLVACCAAALVAARLARGAGEGGAARAWAVLAAVLGLLSLDEIVSLHERGAEWAAAVFETGSLLARLGWTIPAAAILVASLVVLVPAFRAVPRRARLIVVAGLATSIAGALGMEVLNVLLVDAGARYLWRHLAMAVEEAAEMAGVVIVLLGVLTAVRVSWNERGMALAYDDGRADR